MKEIWKPVVGYEGLYEVSNLGRVKSLARDVGRGYKGVNHKYAVDRIRRQGTIDKYYSVSLNKDGKETVELVHRLILKTFKPIEETTKERMESNHKDGNKLNNRLDNLEWVTSKENKKHAFETGLCDHRRGESVYNVKLTEKQVLKIRELSKKEKNLDKIASLYNVSDWCIYNIIHRISWKHLQEVENGTQT